MIKKHRRDDTEGKRERQLDSADRPETSLRGGGKRTLGVTEVSKKKSFA